ncbi:MAG: hypothetical protein ACE5JM_10145, partial [Armatimonadota bacterium]
RRAARAVPARPPRSGPDPAPGGQPAPRRRAARAVRRPVDPAIDGSGDQHRPPYFGTVDWPAVLSALREIRFPGPLTFEVPYLSRWLRPVREGVFGFIEVAMKHAAAPGENSEAKQ